MRINLLGSFIAAVAVVLPAQAATHPVSPVDLATATVAGAEVLNQTPAQIASSFGAPDWRTGAGRRFELGYGVRPNFVLEVRFHTVAGRTRSYAAAFERQPVRDVESGLNLLALTPRLFTTTVKRAYGPRVAVVKKPSCSARLCSVTFASAERAGYRFTFGRAATPLGTYLTLWLASA